MRLSFAVAFCLLLTLDVGGAFAQSPQPLDILGIQIGMSADKAVQILNSHIAELRAENVTMLVQPAKIVSDVLPKPLVWGVRAAAVPGKGAVPAEAIIVVFTMPPNPQVVAEVHRTLEFYVGNKPAKDALLESLRGKYGPESVRQKDPNDIKHRWAFKDSRQQFFNSESSADHLYQSDCERAIASPPSGFSVSDNPRKNLSIILGKASSADVKSKCEGSSHVLAMTSFDTFNKGLVSSLRVSIVDSAMEDAALEKTRTMFQNLAEAKRQEEIKKAKTPKL